MTNEEIIAAAEKYRLIPSQARGGVMARDGIKDENDRRAINVQIADDAAEAAEKEKNTTQQQGEQQAPPPPPTQQAAPPVKSIQTEAPNDKYHGEKPDLSEYEYNPADNSGFKGKKFIEYFTKLLPSLQKRKRYIFEEYRCEAIRVARFPGVQGSPIDVIGVKITQSVPLKTTSMDVEHAIIINGCDIQRIPDQNGDERLVIAGGQFFQSKRIWLLKK